METCYFLLVLLSLLKLYNTRCPDSPEVVLDPSCQRNHNETCSYTCSTGYIPTNISEANNVTCTTLSSWDTPLSSLCEKLKCPTTIPHGHVSTLCSSEYGAFCYDYYCDNGYLKTPDYKTLTCNATGQWDWLYYSTEDFCTSDADLCPATFKNGYVSSSCGRGEGDSCSFSCEEGCKRHSYIFLTCHNKTWDIDTDQLCEDCVQCNHTIPNGAVSMTNCYAGQNCSYYCNYAYKYVKNENITEVVCPNATSMWLPSVSTLSYSSENDLCIPRRCSTYIPNGHFLASCSAEVGSVCRYKCDLDYHGNVSEIYCHSRYRHINHSPWNAIHTYWSVDVHQLCTNSKQCPLDSIPHGSLDQSCSRNPGDICPYTCEYGYRPTHLQSNKTRVTCTSSSTWNASFSLLCEKIVCPSKIPNGYTSCYSSRNYNNHCYDYSCNYGYQRAKDYSSLTCNYDGQWEWTDPSPLKFCLGEEELCPSNIDGGRISYSCHRNEGSFCTYSCNGCRNYTAPSWLTCHNKTWDSDTRYLCTDCTTTTTMAPVRCPYRLPDGRVQSSCSRKPNTWCDYTCDIGCRKKLYSIRCNIYGEWESGFSACSCTTCPFYIPNGYISGSSHIFTGLCDFRTGSTCNVKCDDGCKVQYRTALCESTGHWSLADSLCYCKEPTDTSDGSSTSTVAIVMSVVGVIAFLAIVAGIITACHRRRSKPPSQNTSLSQSGSQQSPYQISTATTNTLGTGNSGSAYCTNTSYIQGPPQYSELSVAKEEQTTPPPSYEDVSPHPLTTAQQPINQTPVNENVSTLL